MKKPICTLLLAGLSLPLFCPASTEPENLVNNGDFEYGSTGWEGGVNIVFETPEERNKICSIAVDKEKRLEFHQEIKTSNMRHVKVKLRIKASADFATEKGPGWFVSLGSRGRGMPLHTGWNDIECRLDNRDDEDTMTLAFKVMPGQSGTLSFDDIEVIEDVYRTFTDKSGRTIQAKIIGADSDGTKVTLQREGSHKSTTVPVTLFDDETQAHIRSWIEISDFLNDRIFPVEFEHEYEKIADKSKADSIGLTLNSWSISSVYYGHYIEMALQNKSKHPFNNVTLEYALFYTQEYHRNGKKEVYAGTLYDKKNIDIPARSTKEIATQQIILHRYSYVSSAYSPGDRDGELEGIIAHLTLQTETGEVVTRKIVYPEKKEFKWTTRTRDVQDHIPKES